MAIYNEMFSSVDDVVREFCINEKDVEGIEIIYAEYVPGDYCGDAWVIFRKEAQLYEVVGSHCSCYGLEGQWEPTPSSVKAILMRPHISEEVRNLLMTFDN